MAYAQPELFIFSKSSIMGDIGMRTHHGGHSPVLQSFIDEQDQANRDTLYSLLSLDNENGTESTKTNYQLFTKVSIDFSSYLIARGFTPIMSEHHVQRTQQADPLGKLPSWVLDLRLPIDAYVPESSTPDEQDRFEGYVQADGSLIAKLHFVGVIGEVNINRSWFELLAAPKTDDGSVSETTNLGETYNALDDRLISIGSSSIHTMELKGGTSILKPGDLLFSSRARCFEIGGGLFFLRRGSSPDQHMRLVYSRKSEEVRRRGDKQNIDSRTTNKQKLEVRIR